MGGVQFVGPSHATDCMDARRSAWAIVSVDSSGKSAIAGHRAMRHIKEPDDAITAASRTPFGSNSSGMLKKSFAGHGPAPRRGRARACQHRSAADFWYARLPGHSFRVPDDAEDIRQAGHVVVTPGGPLLRHGMTVAADCDSETVVGASRDR